MAEPDFLQSRIAEDNILRRMTGQPPLPTPEVGKMMYEQDAVFRGVADALKRFMSMPAGRLVQTNQNGFAIAQPPPPGLGERVVGYLNDRLPRPEQVEQAVLPRVHAAGNAAEAARVDLGASLNEFLRRAAERRPFEASAAPAAQERR